MTYQNVSSFNFKLRELLQSYSLPNPFENFHTHKFSRWAVRYAAAPCVSHVWCWVPTPDMALPLFIYTALMNPRISHSDWRCFRTQTVQQWADEGNTEKTSSSFNVKHYLADHQVGWDWRCALHTRGDKKWTQNFGRKTCTKRSTWKTQTLMPVQLLKLICKKYGDTVWTVFMSLSTRACDGCCEHTPQTAGNWLTSGSPQGPSYFISAKKAVCLIT
jgi:hypothetical protein